MSQIKVRCRGVIVDQGELLLVRHSHGADFYALPGGHLDFGEDPIECITRELVEELGIIPEVGRLLYVYSFINTENIQSIEFFFEITNAHAYRNAESYERSHAHEIEEMVWVKQADTVHILPEAFGTAFRKGAVFDEGTRFLKG